MFKTRYRVVRPYYMSLYVLEYRYWFWPFWNRFGDEYFIRKETAIEILHRMLKDQEVVYEYP